MVLNPYGFCLYERCFWPRQIPHSPPTKPPRTVEAFQIAFIAVLSPILLIAGILHLISTAHIGASAVVLNALAATLGGLRFVWNPPGHAGGVLTVFFVLFLALALAANARLCIRLRAARSRPPAPDREKTPAPRRAPPARVPPGPAPRRDDPKGVKILSPTAWLLHNLWGDIRVYTVPSAIADQNPGLPTSDRRFRITYEEDEPPIDGVFTISSSLQILLPPDHMERLKDKELVRFEIVG